jgi:hypothetical protein
MPKNLPINFLSPWATKSTFAKASADTVTKSQNPQISKSTFAKASVDEVTKYHKSYIIND